MGIKVTNPKFKEEWDKACQRAMDNRWARARAWANANKSDPFAYDQVVKDYETGIAGPFINSDGELDCADYEVQFDMIKSPVTFNGLPLILNGEEVKVDRIVPRNMRRP